MWDVTSLTGDRTRDPCIGSARVSASRPPGNLPKDLSPNVVSLQDSRCKPVSSRSAAALAAVDKSLLSGRTEFSDGPAF